MLRTALSSVKVCRICYENPDADSGSDNGVEGTMDNISDDVKVDDRAKQDPE